MTTKMQNPTNDPSRPNRYRIAQETGVSYSAVKQYFNANLRKRVGKPTARRIRQWLTENGFIKRREVREKHCWNCGVHDPHKPLVSPLMRRKPARHQSLNH